MRSPERSENNMPGLKQSLVRIAVIAGAAALATSAVLLAGEYQIRKCLEEALEGDGIITRTEYDECRD